MFPHIENHRAFSWNDGDDQTWSLTSASSSKVLVSLGFSLEGKN